MNEEISLDDFQAIDGMPEQFDPLTFIINDDDQALWAMRSLAQSQRRLDVVERQAAQEHDRIERWKAHTTKTSRNTVDYFSNALKSYMIRVRESEDRKSLSFPDGDVTSRSVAAKAAVSDLGVFLKWCQETGHTQWVRVKQEADLSAIKDHVEFDGDTVTDSFTGEVIDGLLAIEESVSVTLKVSE